jgi:hypothetical protein
MTYLAVVIGCPGLPSLGLWFLFVGGVLHVLLVGFLLVGWEWLQDRLRQEA